MSTRVRLAGVLAAVLLGTVSTWRVEAHKPITSPYTFTEDVLPILRDRCATCHFAGGPAPMALTTPEETVPWGESIRLELVAGHMPPWSATSNGARLRHAEGLSARELNVLLTWVTGGTPINIPPPPAAAPAPAWNLGTPDAIVPVPEVTVASDQAEITREFALPLSTDMRRPIRAVDLKPGTRSLVRSAQIFIQSSAQPVGAERLLALWVPGDAPTALPDNVAYNVPADAELLVRIRYKKTWEHERDVMSDRSEVGLYFAPHGAEVMRLSPDGAPFGQRLRVLSVFPAPDAKGRRITLDARLPNGEMQRLIEFTPRPGWDRRFAFEPPFELPAGTQLRASEPGSLFVNIAAAPLD